MKNKYLVINKLNSMTGQTNFRSDNELTCIQKNACHPTAKDTAQITNVLNESSTFLSVAANSRVIDTPA